MPDNAAVQEALERILASAGFVNSPRMSRFLRFVVEETAAGRAAGLKEYVVGLRVFDKAESFDPTVDPTVRVEASKLRAKLARYYETEGGGDSTIIEIPKGHYGARFCARPDSEQYRSPAVEAAPASPATGRGAVTVFDQPPAEINEPRPAPRPPTSVRRRAALALGVAALVALGGYAVWVLTVARPTTPTVRIMLAVLPFQNLTGDPEQEYLCDGLTEEMIAHLGGADPARLGVIARTSAMHYKSTTKRADEIGRELGVGYLLETSLRRIGNHLRITAQLIDARSQGLVWVEQYKRDAQDILALQGEVAAAVTRRTMLSLRVNPRSLYTSTERRANSSQAYEHYLRGRYHWVKATPDGLQKALEHFRRAIAFDPSYARAYCGLAETYALLGSYAIMPISESHPLGRQAALTALGLDNSLGEAHRALAAILADHYWDWAEVERHYKRAMELEPSDVTTLRFYSFYLAYTGRPVEALPIAEQACSLDPVSPNARMNLGAILCLARRFDHAARELEETLDLDPNFSFARAVLGLVYISKGLPGRAVAELQKARGLSGTRPYIIAFHGYTLARAGCRREALTALDDLRRLAGPQGPSPFLMALVYTGLEDNDHAFVWLGKAIETRAWEMPMLKVSPVFDRLRSDPRFPALLARVGLPR
jgi:TolB-like protein/Tfp pilus assembly protein PilF